MGNLYGYIRVSTREQNEDRQILALKELSIPEKNLFIDNQSGKDFERPQYRKMEKKKKKDDLLYIKSIDRLGRNYSEILETDNAKPSERFQFTLERVGLDKFKEVLKEAYNGAMADSD